MRSKLVMLLLAATLVAATPVVEQIDATAVLHGTVIGSGQKACGPVDILLVGITLGRTDYRVLLNPQNGHTVIIQFNSSGDPVAVAVGVLDRESKRVGPFETLGIDAARVRYPSPCDYLTAVEV